MEKPHTREQEKGRNKKHGSNNKFTLKALPLQEETSTDLSNAHAVALAKMRDRKRFQSYDANAGSALSG